MIKWTSLFTKKIYEPQFNHKWLQPNKRPSISDTEAFNLSVYFDTKTKQFSLSFSGFVSHRCYWIIIIIFFTLI